MKKLMAGLMLSMAVGGLSLAAGCGGAVDKEGGDACSSDSDCKGDRICEDGECVDPAGSNNGTSANNGTTPSNNGTTPSNNGTTPSNNGTTPSNNGTTPSNNGTTPSNNGGPAAGEIGAECFDSSECNSAYCRAEAGGIGGTCAENDFGDTCQGPEDCLYGACLVRNDGDIAGYCSATCESFTDCPTFWDCGELNNAAGTYCIQD